MKKLYLYFPIYDKRFEKLSWKYYIELFKLNNKEILYFYFKISLFCNLDFFDFKNMITSQRYFRIQRADQIKVHLCRWTCRLYWSGQSDSYSFSSDNYSNRAYQLHRAESAEHSYAYGAGKKNSQGFCAKRGL